MSHPVPASMTAIEIEKPGEADVLVPVTRPVPTPGHGEVLVRVAAAGVNRPDIVQRLGLYPPPPGASDIPGLEIAGEVVDVGPGVTRWSEGDLLTALVAGGGYAEYCLVDASLGLPIPKDMSTTEAAALPETCFTVWTNVFDRAKLQPGESILIHGGTSGIGTTAIQMASCFGAQVFATAGSDKKCAACIELGAHSAINYRDADFVDVIHKETDARGVDVILDMVGGDYVERNIKALATEGRLVNIAFLQGPKVELNLMPLMLKRLTMTGSTLRPRSLEEKTAIAEALEARVWPLISAGRIKPVIDSTFALKDAAQAHNRMESGAHIGKIVLETGA